MTTRLIRLFLVQVLCVGLSWSCSDSQSDKGPTSSHSLGSDSQSTIDVVLTDEGVLSEDIEADVSVPAWTPPEVWEGEAPKPIKMVHWMAASFADWGAASELTASLLSGTLTYPDSGMQYGAWWSAVPPGEDGSIQVPGAGMILYAIGLVEVEEPTAVVVLPDGFARVRSGQQVQPGDVYRSGRHRIPLRLEKGQNLIVAWGQRRNSPPRITLHETTAEVVYNPNDITAPFLLANDETTQWVGIPILNLTAKPLVDARAMVTENEWLEATEVQFRGLAAGAVTQVPFQLKARPGLLATEEPISVDLQFASPQLEWSYTHTVNIQVKPADFEGALQRTFRSSMDGSAQFYGVRRPINFDKKKKYSLVLSLHGAGVNARNQAGSYAAKDWAYVVAPTNRRPFGFDWETFGRLDGLEVLDFAMSNYPIDPSRVYLTGHSMGGHGTWQFSHLFPGRFAVVGPSAGWISFATYSSKTPYPTGPFGWASFSSQTLKYKTNLAGKKVYIIHGTADDNVPISEAKTMVNELKEICPDLQYHWQEGAGHWWDSDVGKGVDCVDWPPLFDLMKSTTLDTTPTDFSFTSPSPSVSPHHSYLTLMSAESPDAVMKATSKQDETKVTLTTLNVRSMRIDGAALKAKGVTSIVVNSEAIDVIDQMIEVGPQSGKRPEAYGPLVQVFQQPFCLVYADNGPPAYRNYAAMLISTWNIIGNGSACALPFSELTDDVRQNRNIVYLGLTREQVPLPENSPFNWEKHSVSVNGQSQEAAGLGFVFPEGKRLGAVLVTTRTHEYLLERIQPFSSRFFIPDWLIWSDSGAQSAGFYSSEWQYDKSLSIP